MALPASGDNGALRVAVWPALNKGGLSVFKNMIIYRIAPQWQIGLEQVEEALAKVPFLECGATQERSWGWVPPRGEAHGPLAESVGGQWVLRFMVESKVLPGSVLARRVEEKAVRIEQETGRKPGKKESKELKDEAKLDLLPMAFTKQGAMWVWLDLEARMLVLDTSSQGRADEVVTALVEALPGLSVALLDTATEGQGKSGKDDSGFDADVAIATGELRLLIPDLIEALGGESERGIGAGASPAGSSAGVADKAPAASAAPFSSQSGAITGPAKAPVDTAPEDAPF